MSTSTQIAAEDSSTTDSLPAKLDQLKAAATQQYSLKNYNLAAEHYSEAASLQDELNGEMSPDNADLLYQYGRCLYHVAVSNSDVLGGKVAGTGEERKRKRRKVGGSGSAANGEGSSGGGGGGGLIGDALKDGEQKMAEEVVEAAVDEKGDSAAMKQQEEASKPYFQITGDENFTDSEDEDEEAAADEEAEEEEDDFAIAYEILDVARVLLGRKVESSQDDAAEQRQLKERLADTHDLQAEISLENERFHDAIKDTRESLELKTQLYPEESSLLAEAHFKLSLALEFASVTSTSTDTTTTTTAADEADPAKPPTQQVDESMRAEAAAEMERAIASCTARIALESHTLSTLTTQTSITEQQKSIADVKEMVADMQARLVDLRNPAVSLAGGGAAGPAGAPGGEDPLRGVLGAMLGESKGEQQRRIQEATEGARDLSGLVKKGKKGKGVEVEGKGKGKRRVEDAEAEAEEVGSGKKVKFEDEA